jgi:hypothetical protein
MSVDSKLPPYVKELIYKYKDNTKKQYSKHLGYLFYMNYGKYNPYESGDVEIVSEDENLKIVKVLSKDAAFYFGGDLYSQNWDDNFSEGDLYFLISTDPDVQEFSIHNRNDQEPSVIRYGYDRNSLKNTDDLKSIFPNSVKLLGPLIRYGKTFEFLKSIYNGYEPRWNENGEDDLIYNIDFNKNNPRQSIVEIVIDNEDTFLDIFDIENDDRYEWSYYMSDYGGINYDYDGYYDSWRDGDFIGWYFNEENKQRIINIVRSYYPTTSPDDNRAIHSLLNDKIDENFVSSIVDEYAQEYEDCVYDEIRSIINSEFQNPFMRFGIKEKNRNYKYIVPLNVLLTWYKQLKIEDLKIEGLLQTLIQKFDKTDRGYWSELRYDTSCKDWDDEKYQKFVSDQIEKLEEKLSDDERFVNYEEYKEIVSTVDQEYGFEKWIPVKTDENTFFKIDKVDPATNKIIITLRNNTSDEREQKRSVDFEDLKRIETQYELFEQIKRIVGILK